MGIEPGDDRSDVDIDVFRDTLDSENITFVDALNDEIAAVGVREADEFRLYKEFESTQIERALTNVSWAAHYQLSPAN